MRSLKEETKIENEARLNFWKNELVRISNVKPLSGGPAVIARVAKGNIPIRQLPGYESRVIEIKRIIKKYQRKLGLPVEKEDKKEEKPKRSRTVKAKTPTKRRTRLSG